MYTKWCHVPKFFVERSECTICTLFVIGKVPVVVYVLWGMS